jgi:hypothetical protein
MSSKEAVNLSTNSYTGINELCFFTEVEEDFFLLLLPIFSE